mgnify:CR=1 FL=1
MELTIQQCYNYLFWGVLAALAVCVIAVLLYILRSRLTVDRIIGINLIGTLVVIIICALTYVLIYIGLYDRRRKEKKHDR